MGENQQNTQEQQKEATLSLLLLLLLRLLLLQNRNLTLLDHLLLLALINGTSLILPTSAPKRKTLITTSRER